MTVCRSGRVLLMMRVICVYVCVWGGGGGVSRRNGARVCVLTMSLMATLVEDADRETHQPLDPITPTETQHRGSALLKTVCVTMRLASRLSAQVKSQSPAHTAPAPTTTRLRHAHKTDTPLIMKTTTKQDTHLWLESHVKHAVSLIEHQVCHTPQVCHSTHKQVDQAPGSGGNNLQKAAGEGGGGRNVESIRQLCR